MAIDLYYPFWSLLEHRFDIVVHDLRNHGRNPTGPVEGHTVEAFAEDLAAVLDAIDESFGSQPKIGAFHSISATTALIREIEDQSFEALVLYEPVLYDAGLSEDDIQAAQKKRFGKTRQRIQTFRSRADYANLLRHVPFFAGTLPGVTELAAETTLRPTPDGAGYVLCCPPEYEARILESGSQRDGHAHLLNEMGELDFDRIACPTKIIGADPANPFLPTLDFNRLPGIEYEYVPDTTHLLPLEKPRRCARLLLEFLTRKEILQA